MGYVSDSRKSCGELINVSLFKKERGLESDTLAIVELNKHSFLEEAVLESSSTLGIHGVDKEAGSEAFNSSDGGFLGDSGLNLLFHAFT